MNSFDVVIYVGLIVAVVTGFNAGLLRSAVTMLAYLFAMPIAVWATSMVSPSCRGQAQFAMGAEFAAVLRDIPGRRHRAGKNDAHGA